MEYMDRISYSQEQMLQSLEAALDQLNTFRYDTRYKSILGENFIDKLNSWVTTIRKQKDNPYTVVVIGDFKRGKSTLINALLKQEVATTDVTTETVTLNKISYGLHGNEAILSGNRHIRLTDAELKRENIERIMAETGEHIQQINITRDNEILKKITILDTPGTGDAMEDFSEVVRESLLMADAVIYVYNVQYPLSITEQLFLKSAVLSKKHTALFLVGNYADVLGNEKGFESARGLVSKRIHDLVPNAEILLVSALDEVCRINGEERPNDRLTPVLEQQFDRLRELLNESIVARADAVVLDRMQRLTTAMVEDLFGDIEAMEKGLDMDTASIHEAMNELAQNKEKSIASQKQVLEDLEKLNAELKDQCQLWMGTFLQRMEHEALSLESWPYETIVKHYEFYCIDLLQQALSSCVEFHQEVIYDRMELISENLSEQYALGIQKKQKYGFRVSLDNRIWTKGDTVGFVFDYVSSFVPMLRSVSSLITDGISGHMRQQELKKSTPDMLVRITEQLPKMNKSVHTAIETIYTEMGNKAQKLVQEHYAEKMEQAEHLVQQTAAVARKETAQKDEIRALLQEARNLLTDVADIT